MSNIEDATARIQTGLELAVARRRLGLSHAELAAMLRMTGVHAERHLRDMEIGTRELGGPIAASVGLMLEMAFLSKRRMSDVS